MVQSPGNAEVLPPGPPAPPADSGAAPLVAEQAAPGANPPLALESLPPGESLAELLPIVPSWLASLVFHLLLVLLLATWGVLQPRPDLVPSLIISTSGGLPEARGELDDDLSSSTALLTADPQVDPQALDSTAIDMGPPAAIDPGPLLADLPVPLGSTDLDTGSGGVSVNPDQGLSLRTDAELRRALVISGGGTPESEAAVAGALAWLAAHQLEDGRWSFQHGQHPECRGQCSHDGNHQTDVAATGLALLPFLGAGHTHLEGRYRETVRRGLEYLVNSIKVEDDLGSLWQPQGTMYSHGLASIALCEAFGMTGDRWLYLPAQRVVNYIIDAQDPSGGGWRYSPRMPGDTSVVGWQLMALKSAHMAELRVPPAVFRKTTHFLDSVAVDNGAGYGYTGPQTGMPTTSAVGLLCRMYLGWNHRTRGLRLGVVTLHKQGPAIDAGSNRCNLYFNYYATQVMRHWGGTQWRDWNAMMRDFLVNSQNHQGHTSGSWYFDGDRGSGPGGRLYCTAMSAMILEVYYRHLPLYGERSLRQ